ncbi:MAG: hypothetical protein ALECFALPRED_004611 [Alectoria fallacina]|uniref:Suppressor of anucleate metulae protein B n=1 Tax=Alectoria fallacina TaxID=1903189 RepID=A0A8H3IW11_9LECA|nr:MAG: hypothetical protein ALECFALPRED_004611 [Alectoria fallacina]
MPDQSLLDGAKTKTKLSIETSSLAVDGLGLIATAVIPAGEDVFSKQQILNIADSAHLITTCDCCFIWLGDSVNLRTYTISAENSGTILKKCGGCQVVRYCSTSCQRKAWKSHHKAECKVYAEKYIEDVYLRATIRLLCMRKLGTISDSQWYWVNRMQSHMEDYCRSEQLFRQAISEAASMALRWTGMADSEEVIRELYCRIKLNHMTNIRMESETTGITLDPLAAIINHSCDPNAFCFFEGTKIRVRSLRPIVAGEEITISYTDDTLARDTRRGYLTRWFFDCACEKCAKNASDDVLKIPRGFNVEALNDAMQSFDFSQPDKSDFAIFGAGGPGVGWPADLQPIPNLHSHLATGYRAKTMFSDPTVSHEVQLNLLSELRHRLPLCFVGDPAIRPISTHPMRVINLFMLTMLLRRILLVLKDTSKFPDFKFQRTEVGLVYKYYMMKVHEDAPISHGKDSPLAVSVAELMRRDFAVAGDPAMMLASMKDDQLQTMRGIHLRMLQWSGMRV